VFEYSRSECNAVLAAVYRFPLPGDAAVTRVKRSFGAVEIEAGLETQGDGSFVLHSAGEELQALLEWVKPTSLPKPELDYEVCGPSGEVMTVVDLAWTAGVQDCKMKRCPPGRDRSLWVAVGYARSIVNPSDRREVF